MAIIRRKLDAFEKKYYRCDYPKFPSLHTRLVHYGARWLKKSCKCKIVLEEPFIWYSMEQPDVIGWELDGTSYLLEAKASRSDFFADKKKPHRKNNIRPIGMHRFYLCPPEMIHTFEVPEDWGLLWAYLDYKRVVIKVKKPGPLRKDYEKVAPFEKIVLIAAHRNDR